MTYHFKKYTVVEVFGMKLLGPHALTSLIVKDIPIFSSLVFASF